MILNIYGFAVFICIIAFLLGIIILVRGKLFHYRLHRLLGFIMITAAIFSVYYILITVTFPVTISADEIEQVIHKQPQIQHANVDIDDNTIEITGIATVKKYFVTASVNFLITLRPVEVSDGQLIMKIVRVEPLNIEYLNKEIFNQPPYFTYRNELIRLNMAQNERLKRLPLEIRSFELNDGELVLNMGFERDKLLSKFLSKP